ncbi:hypothetical protein KBC79_02605 [Candidatus Woesebacteria bacterium]|nr:hypothetical protein [Candidatus Woesebacteria bacterium]
MSIEQLQPTPTVSEAVINQALDLFEANPNFETAGDLADVLEELIRLPESEIPKYQPAIESIIAVVEGLTEANGMYEAAGLQDINAMHMIGWLKTLLIRLDTVLAQQPPQTPQPPRQRQTRKAHFAGQRATPPPQAPPQPTTPEPPKPAEKTLGEQLDELRTQGEVTNTELSAKISALRSDPVYQALLAMPPTVTDTQLQPLRAQVDEIADDVENLQNYIQRVTYITGRLTATTLSDIDKLARLEQGVKKLSSASRQTELSVFVKDSREKIETASYYLSHPDFVRLRQKFSDVYFDRWKTQPVGSRDKTIYQGLLDYYTELFEMTDDVEVDARVAGGDAGVAIQKLAEELKGERSKRVSEINQFWPQMFNTADSYYDEFNPTIGPSYTNDIARHRIIVRNFNGTPAEADLVIRSIQNTLSRAQRSLNKDPENWFLAEKQFSNYLNNVVWDLAELLIEQMEAKKKALQENDNSKSGREKIIKDITDFLLAAERNPGYTVSTSVNEVKDSYVQAKRLFATYESKKPPTAESLAVKEKIVFTYYKLYRRVLFLELEKHEGSNTPASKIMFDPIFERVILLNMENLVAELTGITMASVSDLEQMLKSGSANPHAVTIDTAINAAVGQLPGGSNQKWEQLVRDLFDVRIEYVNRKFTIYSWTHLLPIILGENGRKYPEGVIPDTHPAMLVVQRSLRGGLRNPEFGVVSNPLVEKDRKSHPISTTQVDQREQVTYDATVFGEVWRVLDRWATEKLTLYGSNKAVIQTDSLHQIEDPLVHDIIRYLKDRATKQGNDPTIYVYNDVLRAYRNWAMTTFHQSARARRSAKGADTIYYQHNFSNYNAQYNLAGTLNWYPQMAAMLFALPVEPGSPEKFNPLPILLGDDEYVKQYQGYLSRFSPLPQGYTAMVSQMASKGWLERVNGVPAQLTASQSAKAAERLQTEGWSTYDFLLSPLLSMHDATQVQAWKDSVDATGRWVRVPAPENDYPEYFTMTPLLGTVFLRDKDGKVIYYPDSVGADGTVYKGRPVSYLDRQDEWGEIMYESLPFEEGTTDLLNVLSSLGTNGAKFLNDFLKSKGVVETLKNGQDVAYWKNQAKYAMIHFPSWGINVAAGESKDKVLRNMVITQIVFTVALIKTDPSEKDFWGTRQLRDFLNSLVNVSHAISQETSDVIYETVMAANTFRIGTANFMRAFLDNLQKRFAYSDK